MKRAALLDNNSIFIRIVELPDAAPFGPLHVPAITECDLPPGKYKWVPDAANPYGGAFWALEWLERVAADQQAIQRAASAAADLVARRAARKAQRGE